MRNAFARAVTELAANQPDLVLLTGDIGNRLFDRFKERYPNRFYNCGVAEAGMTGIAGGLAASGLRPITYTITPFNTVRCLEQIRLDICYPDYPVVVVGTGAGLSYASLGASHHSMEDIGLLRMLPNMHVVCPGDTIEVELAVRAAYEHKKPTYIRLGKKGEPRVHEVIPDFQIGRGIVLQEGEDIALLAVGNMLPVARDVVRQLEFEGFSVCLVSLHTVKPLDDMLLTRLFDRCRRISIVEEHGRAGGAGSAVLEWACNHRMDATKVLCFGAGDEFLTACGNQQQARTLLGLEAETITSTIKNDL